MERVFDYIAFVSGIRDFLTGTPWENKVWTVGGFSRSRMIGILTGLSTDVHDLDLITSIDPEGLSQKLMDEGLEPSVTSYGTYLINHQGVPVEITLGSPDDYIYRDLTINSIYFSLWDPNYIDPSGGKRDLKEKILRCPGDPWEVYREDPVKVLRVIRFYGSFKDFTLDPSLMKPLEKAVKRLGEVPRELITSEFSKTLETGSSRAISLMKSIGVFKVILPALDSLSEVTQGSQHIGDVWKHTMAALEYNEKTTTYSPIKRLVIRLAILLHDIGKLGTRSVGKDGKIHFYGHELRGSEVIPKILDSQFLRFPNDVIQEVSWIVKEHMRTKSWGSSLSVLKDPPQAIRKLCWESGSLGRLGNLLEVIEADNNSHSESWKITGQMGKIYGYLDQDAQLGIPWMFSGIYQPPLTGDEIMEALGIPAGPKVGELKKVLMAKLFRDPLETKENLIKYLKNYEASRSNT